MDGFLNINKPAGMTSHDVVSFVRRLLHTKRVGHTGTLDPEATGVLVVCVGKATRLVEYILEDGKTYSAKMLLGVVTDTQDTEGTVLSENEVEVTEEDIIAALPDFRGEVKQIPPMYSALKKNGKKLYELARQGIEVEREPRLINIYELNYDGREENTVDLTVKCSKGTYIRTLCHDLGDKLGCGACMKELKRTRVGSFTLENAWGVEELKALEEPEKALLPIKSEYLSLPVLKVTKEGEDFLKVGKALSPEQVIGEVFGTVLLENEEGKILAVGEYKDNRCQPRKVFC